MRTVVPGYGVKLAGGLPPNERCRLDAVGHWSVKVCQKKSHHRIACADKQRLSCACMDVSDSNIFLKILTESINNNCITLR